MQLNKDRIRLRIMYYRLSLGSFWATFRFRLSKSKYSELLGIAYVAAYQRAIVF